MRLAETQSHHETHPHDRNQRLTSLTAAKNLGTTLQYIPLTASK